MVRCQKTGYIVCSAGAMGVLSVIKVFTLHSHFWRTFFLGIDPSLYLAVANNNPLRTLSAISLVVRLSCSVVKLIFIVRGSLAAPVIPGCDFCDRFVEAIRPRTRSVQLADGSIVPIVKKPLL